MSTAEFHPALPASLQERIVAILVRPKTEWPVIEAESTSTEKLYREYIALLAAIPVIASFIGMSLVGTTVLNVTVRVGVVRGFIWAVVSYILGLLGVFVAAVVIEKLAPAFESRPDRLQALKLVAYSCTPVWLAGALYIIPALSPIAMIVSLYSLYLFYLGTPVLMKTPAAKVVPYMIVAAVITIVVSVAMSMIAGSITGVNPTVTM